jgi:RNA polymerase sigma-70 factor (ECF subfamily)
MYAPKAVHPVAGLRSDPCLVCRGLPMSPLANPDLAGLLALSRQGDGEALGRLLELYRGYLLLLCQMQLGRRLQSKTDAADLVQDTFLEAYRDFGQFQGTTEGQLVAWLRRILATNLANLIRRYLGTQERDVRLERELVEELDRSSGQLDRGLAAPQSSPSEEAARREQSVILADALGQLPEDYREAIVLRHLQGLSFPEVAARMGRSVDSVEKLWARGLVRLRQVLEGTS